MRLHLAPIDLARDFELCVRFRTDAQICSFGSAEGFVEHAGPEYADYRAWVAARQQRLPDSCLHAWLGGRIVGQLEMGLDRETDDGGYVNLYYLIPELRGSGLADQLVDHSLRYFCKLGCKRARLTVSVTNTRAIRFYRRHGFVDVGPRPDRAGHRFMERLL